MSERIYNRALQHSFDRLRPRRLVSVFLHRTVLLRSGSHSSGQSLSQHAGAHVFQRQRVGYREPAKYTAKMRATRTDHNTIILKTNMNPAGHGGVSGCYDCLRENAFDYACFLTKWASTTDRILHVRSSAHFVLLFFPIKSQS
jgi:hypothetical protein